MAKEFNLSEKKVNMGIVQDEWVYPEKDIKEFIKRLKEELKISEKILRKGLREEFKCWNWNIYEKLDKLAGPKLTKS